MKKNKKSEFVLRVDYAENPEQAGAALEILRLGFQRGLLKLAVERKSPGAKEEAL